MTKVKFNQKKNKRTYLVLLTSPPSHANNNNLGDYFSNKQDMNAIR